MGRRDERLPHFALTWEFGGDVSWVDVRFSEEETSRARLTLTYTVLHSEHWREYGPGATGVGWESGLMGLAVHIAHPTEPKPDASQHTGKKMSVRHLDWSGSAPGSVT